MFFFSFFNCKCVLFYHNLVINYILITFFFQFVFLTFCAFLWAKGFEFLTSCPYSSSFFPSFGFLFAYIFIYFFVRDYSHTWSHLNVLGFCLILIGLTFIITSLSWIGDYIDGLNSIRFESISMCEVIFKSSTGLKLKGTDKFNLANKGYFYK